MSTTSDDPPIHPATTAWADLKDRLRSFVLMLRSDGTHFYDILEENAVRTYEEVGGEGHLTKDLMEMEELIAILRALNFPLNLPRDPNQHAYSDSEEEEHPETTYLNLTTGPSQTTDDVLILKRFGNFRSQIAYKKLYASLELEPPEDQMDPHAWEDHLPQPYRMVAKLVDGVFEGVWEKLRGRHPGLKELHVKDQELYGLGPARKVNEIAESALASPSTNLAAFGTVTACEWSSGGGICVVGTSTGHMLLLNPKVSTSVDGTTESLRLSSFQPNDAILASNCVLGSTAVFTNVPNGVSHVSRPARFTVAGVRGVRVGLVAPFNLPLEKEAVPGKEKGGKGKKEETVESEGSADVETGPLVSNLVVVEAWKTLGAGSGNSGNSYSCKIICCGQTQAPVESLSLSNDGKVLAVGCLDGAGCIYSLPEAIAPEEEEEFTKKSKNKMKSIDENTHTGLKEGGKEVNDEGVENDDEEGVIPEVPIYDLGQPDIRLEPPPEPEGSPLNQDSVEDGGSVVSAASKSKKTSAAGEQAGDGEPKTAEQLASAKSRYLPRFIFLPGPPLDRSFINTVGRTKQFAASILVWRTQSNVWKRFRLPSFSGSLEDASGEGDAGAEEKKTRVTKTTAEELKDSMIGRWVFPSPITAAEVDLSGSGKIAFGCEDGAVVLWDSHSDIPIATPSKHSAAVTAIALCYGSRHLVTGSLIGNIHVIDLNCHGAGQGFKNDGNKNNQGAAAEGAEQGTEARASDAEGKKDKIINRVLADPRDKTVIIAKRYEDFNVPIVNAIALRGGQSALPLVAVAGENGVVVVYDCSTGDLVGKLSPITITGHASDTQNDSSRFLTVTDTMNLCQRLSINSEEEEDGEGEKKNEELNSSEGIDTSVELKEESPGEVDEVRNALDNRLLLSGGGDCITLITAGEDLQKWRPPKISNLVLDDGSKEEEEAKKTMAGNDGSLAAGGINSELSEIDASNTQPATKLAVFPIGDIITALCPGIAKCFASDTAESLLGSAPARHLAMKLFSKLSPADRKNPNFEVPESILGKFSEAGAHGGARNATGRRKTGTMGGSRHGSMSRVSNMSRQTGKSGNSISTAGGAARRMSGGVSAAGGAARKASGGLGNTSGSIMSGSEMSALGGDESVTVENYGGSISKGNSSRGGAGAGGAVSTAEGAARKQPREIPPVTKVVWMSDPSKLVHDSIRRRGNAKISRAARDARIQQRQKELLASLK